MGDHQNIRRKGGAVYAGTADRDDERTGKSAERRIQKRAGNAAERKIVGNKLRGQEKIYYVF